MSYHYLAASLPPLAIDEPPAVDWEEFLGWCAVFVPGDGMAALRRLAGEPADEPIHHAYRDWMERETQILNAVVRHRAVGRRTSPSPYFGEEAGFDCLIAATIDTALEVADPLGREAAVDRARWAAAEEMARGDAFGLEAIFGYAVRLRIALRWAAMSDEAGAERLEELVVANLRPISQEGAA